MNQETEGTTLAFIVLILLSLDPVVIKANPSNPISFIAASALFASSLLWIAGRKSVVKDIRKRPDDLKRAFLTGLFATAVAYSLLAYGTGLSSAINSALLTRFEVFYSFVISWVLLKERITKRAILAAVMLIAGVFIVVLRGGMSVRKGDVLLLLTPFFWQIGHAMAKKTGYSAVTIATLRNTFGGLLLLPVAIITGFEFTKFSLAEGIIMALIQSVWYGSIRRINLSKATAILTPAPALTVVLSYTILGEIPAINQLIGLGLITLGTIIVSREKSGNRE